MAYQILSGGIFISHSDNWAQVLRLNLNSLTNLKFYPSSAEVCPWLFTFFILALFTWKDALSAVSRRYVMKD